MVAVDEERHALAFLVGEGSANRLAALLAVPGALDDLGVGNLFSSWCWPRYSLWSFSFLA